MNTKILGSSHRAAEIADLGSICEWNGGICAEIKNMSRSGAQEYYDSIISMYADWGR